MKLEWDLWIRLKYNCQCPGFDGCRWLGKRMLLFVDNIHSKVIDRVTYSCWRHTLKRLRTKMFFALVLQFFISLELFQNKKKGGKNLFLTINTMWEGVNISIYCCPFHVNAIFF